MDPFTHFFDGPRARRAFAVTLRMTAPWGIEVCDGATLTVLAVTRGHAVVDGTGLGAGDVALVTGPQPYRVTDATGTTPGITIGRGQTCATTDGVALHETFRRGVRRWGNAPADADTEVLVGTYDRPGDAGGFVTRALPRLIVVRSGDVDTASLTAVLARELADDGPATQTVVDRLLDVLVLSAVRSWLRDPGRPAGAGWLTCTDPVVTAALAELHAAPGARWTVGELARRVHLSRASLSARFRASVGEPPMTHLTRWRMTVAADLLLAPDARVGEIARSVGYDDPEAFSTAFRRHTGRSPSAHRHRRPVLAT